MSKLKLAIPKMDELSYPVRIQQAVLAFVRNHPGITLDEIIEKLSFEPSDVTEAVLLLERGREIWSNSDNVDHSRALTKYYPSFHQP